MALLDRTPNDKKRKFSADGFSYRKDNGIDGRDLCVFLFFAESRSGAAGNLAAENHRRSGSGTLPRQQSRFYGCFRNALAAAHAVGVDTCKKDRKSVV